ncbi:MAG TPA: carbon-nitrogen hydrolase family protein [Solirubrobacteraceae bacterium]|nr:carbon-nitrogen hydrolase family protein [Solirubrobacteraceae bacterium]
MRAAAVQLSSTEDTERNLEKADLLVRDAIGRGAELVVLPEKWTVLGSPEQLEAGAQPLDGPAISWAQSTAREFGVEIVAGSIVEHVPELEKNQNTSVHVGPDGHVRAVYHKLHMFDVEVEGVLYAESAQEQAGDEVIVSELASGTGLGMTICYDLRFPELYRMLAARGAEIISVPSAFTVPTTRDHWEILLRARAIENQCYIVAANQVGTHGGGYRSGGRSMIVDPWGLVLASAPDTECAIVAELDFDQLQTIRGRIPVLSHRREDMYGFAEAVAQPSGAAG